MDASADTDLADLMQACIDEHARLRKKRSGATPAACQALMQRARQHKRPASDYLIWAATNTMVTRLARKCNLDNDTAHDICADVAQKLINWSKTEPIHLRFESFNDLHAYVWVCVHHAAVDIFRRRVPVVSIDEMGEIGEPTNDETVSTEIELEALMKPLDFLERRVILLRHRLRLSVPEISTLLSRTGETYSTQSVYRLLETALQKMRRVAKASPAPRVLRHLGRNPGK